MQYEKPFPVMMVGTAALKKKKENETKMSTKNTYWSISFIYDNKVTE